MCWYASSCASKSSKDAQLINACEEPDTMVACEGNYVAEGGEFDRSTTNKVHLVLFGFVWCFAL